MTNARALRGLAALGWARMQGPPVAVLLLKTCGVLALALTARRLLALG